MDVTQNKVVERLKAYLIKNSVDLSVLSDPTVVDVNVRNNMLYIDEWKLDIKKPTITDLRNITLTETNTLLKTVERQKRQRRPEWKVLKAVCDKLELDIETILST